MTTTIQDKAIKTCERLSCHEILGDDAECLQQEWDCDPRWNGIHRPYTPEEVLKLRGTLKLEHTFAEVGAQRLWHLLQTEDYIAALGAMTGNQAVQQVEAGLKAIYLSGWQVAGDIEIVLPQFHAFAHDSVLVAHNAAFDLAFLHQCEELCGLHFEQPTLDTLLLSAVLHDHLSEHTLDAIAERFGVSLFDRHKALGDAMGTAQILLRMLDLLAAEGIETLGDALTASAQAVEIRRRQQEQFGPQRGRKVVAGPTA